jgi:AraC family transcriptional regulator of adaptative response/methylated-DNA-[protein]-cysteine methyltransferase
LGEVRSYSEIAQALNIPRATRAVARACGANSIALLIPCHRVIRSDGSLGGYRWGLEAKRRLLATEYGARFGGPNFDYQGISVTGDIPETI